MKKVRKFLKRNEVIIDFISKIVFGTFSLILLIIANNLVKEQTKAEKENTAPMFYIEKTNDIKGIKNVYKLENKGGTVSHLKLQRMETFTISINCNKVKQEIYYANTLDEDKVNKKNTWYFSPKQQYINNISFRDKVLNALEERYPGKRVIVTIPSSYYKITYHDYLNNYKEDYYYDAKSYVTYSKDMGNDDEDSNYNLYSVIMVQEKNEDDFLKVYLNSITGYYDSLFK